MITSLVQNKLSYNIKIGVQLLLILLTLPFVGQSQNFNKKYEISPNSGGAFGVEIIANDSLIIFPSNFANGLSLNSVILNFNGDTLRSSLHAYSNKLIGNGWANTSDPTNDGGFIFGGGVADTATFGYLVKFNRLGDTLWTRTFGDTTNWFTFRQAIATDDGGFAAVGSYEAVGQRSDGWLVKTDSNGVLVWQKFYSLSLGSLETLTSLQQTSDGGFILGGREQEFPTQNTRNSDPIVIKTDSLGNQEWRYKHDTPANDALAYAIQTQDGNFVFGASKSIFERIPHPSVAQSKAIMVKLDVNGNLLWEKEYGHLGRNHGIQVVKELQNGDLIACGRRRELGGSDIYGLLLKTTSNGDSIWIHDYEFDATQSRSLNYLWDVIQMPDGGFVACGETNGGIGLNSYQDTWLIRVDSNGCIRSNCTVGAESLKPKARSLNLYPNPTSGLVNLETDKVIERIRVFDVKGQLLVRLSGVEITSNRVQFELPEKSGLYFIKIQTEGELITKKIIKH